MAAANILLQKNIIIYSNTPDVCKFLCKYTSNDINIDNDILIAYKNNNHFNILVNSNDNLHTKLEEKEISKIHNKID